MNNNPGIRNTDIHRTSLTQCAPDMWRDAGGLCLSCPFDSHRRRSVAGTHRLLKSPDRDTDHFRILKHLGNGICSTIWALSPPSQPGSAASFPLPRRLQRVHQHHEITPPPWGAGCGDVRLGGATPRGGVLLGLQGLTAPPVQFPPHRWMTPLTLLRVDEWQEKWQWHKQNFMILSMKSTNEKKSI